MVEAFLLDLGHLLTSQNLVPSSTKMTLAAHFLGQVSAPVHPHLGPGPGQGLHQGTVDSALLSLMYKYAALEFAMRIER